MNSENQFTKGKQPSSLKKEQIINNLKALLNIWKENYTNYEIAYLLNKEQEIIVQAIKYIKEN